MKKKAKNKSTSLFTEEEKNYLLMILGHRYVSTHPKNNDFIETLALKLTDKKTWEVLIK